MQIIGYLAVIFLGGFVQFLWLSRGRRNTPGSALLLIAIAVGGVAILGWSTLGALIAGMILGPVFASQRSHIVESAKTVPAGAIAPTDAPPVAKDEPSLPIKPSNEDLADFIARAKIGDAGALYQIARYLFEIGQTETGMALLHRSLDKGNRKALAFMPLIYENGFGVPRCSERAKWWSDRYPDDTRYRPARVQGEVDFGVTHTRARDHLISDETAAYHVKLINQGIFKSGPSHEETLERLRQAAEQGTAAAQYELARNLFEIADTDAEVAEVVSILIGGTEMGFGRSAGFLSTMFEIGEGVAKDMDKAKEWAVRGSQADLKKARGEFGYNNMRRSLRKSMEAIAVAKAAEEALGLSPPEKDFVSSREIIGWMVFIYRVKYAGREKRPERVGYVWEANHENGGVIFDQEGSGEWDSEEDAYTGAERELREFEGV